MKLFKYNQFIVESKTDIDSICEKYGIQNYTINEDGSIDVNGNVFLSIKKLTKIPLKFRNVSGFFYCSNNQLTSLEGCPENVGDIFDCSHNKLTSLEGCPKNISSSFDCGYNQLTSLEGCPENVGDYFYFNNNLITDFKGFPEYYECELHFQDNPVEELLNLFKYHLKCIYWINEHDVIQGNKIIYNRLEEVAYELKMDLPENLTFENYEII